MKSIFARHGTVDVLITDNGPQFTSSKFKQFTKDWEIMYKTSSPYYPKSNGLAGSAVKVTKNIIKKCIESGEDIYKGLLAYRATPLASGLSPAEMLMGRRIKTTLPASECMFKTKSHKKVFKDSQKRKEKQKKYHDRFSKNLKPLKTGDHVHMQDHTTGLWKHNATVMNEVSPRLYNIQTDNGVVYRRNRINRKPFSSVQASEN